MFNGLRYECYVDADALERKVKHCIIEKIYDWDHGPWFLESPSLCTDSIDEAQAWLDRRYKEAYDWFRDDTEYAPYEIEYCERKAFHAKISARVFDRETNTVLEMRAA
jgi:hypothetical protein